MKITVERISSDKDAFFIQGLTREELILVKRLIGKENSNIFPEHDSDKQRAYSFYKAMENAAKPA